ncbi:Sensor protein fixL [Roseomonas mucosa]|uniref:histidine kinase n=1 Tax=Roseomonas mucosa TaxID=207340 RepID=A0A379MZ21_9PROT|nr:PAS domain-containing protein [Roseomonas mucosa]SUE38811.1 Sensor protein fixL [Roseomonas mucosa]
MAASENDTAGAQDAPPGGYDDAERIQLALAAGAITGTWFWDLPTDRFTIDEQFAQAFGIDPALGRQGLSLEQVIATVHPDDKPGLAATIGEVIARGGPYAHQYRVRRADGRYYWIEANGRVDKAPDGTPLRFPGVLLDLEQRRAIEAERDRANILLRSFIEAVPGVVYAKDREGRMLLANKGTTELIGKPPDFYLGRTDREFLDDTAQAEAVMANDRRIMESGILEQVEEEVRRPDGTPATWLSTKAPSATGAARSSASSAPPSTSPPARRPSVSARPSTPSSNSVSPPPSPNGSRPRPPSASPRRWKPSDSSPAASRTTSTTSSPASSAPST